MNWKESYSDQIENLISYSKLIYQRGLVSAAGGNISARCGRHVLITGSNIPLRAVTPEGLVLCDENGTVLDAPPHLRPSKESAFHLGIYRIRPSAQYVLHTVREAVPFIGVGLIAIVITTFCPEYINFFVNLFS